MGAELQPLRDPSSNPVTGGSGRATGVALCLLSASLYTLLFPPFDHGRLAWVALVPLFVAFTRMRPLAAAGAGLLWALAATVGIAWWLPATFERYFDVSPPVAWAGLLAGGLLLDGLPYALLGAWVAWVSRRRPLAPWALGAAFALAEYARANVSLGNPFALVAYSQHGGPFAQLADLAGPYGIGWLIAGVNATLAGLLAPALRTASPRRSLAAAAALVAAAWGYGALRSTQDFDSGDPIRVAVVQSGIARELHVDESLRAERLESTLALTRTAAAARPDIIFWPEYAVDFYLRDPSRERSSLLSAARGLGADLVLGAPDYRVRNGTPHFYNSVFLLEGDAILGRHDKVRLVPFAEYGPLGSWLRAETALYEPGDAAQPLGARTARVGAFLCSEALDSRIARALVRNGAELLANPSNDYWLGAPAAALQQVQVAAFRAIETRRYLVRSTPTGYSAVIDPHGRVRALSQWGGSDLLASELHRSRAITPYVRFGDLACAVALAAVLSTSLSAGLRALRDPPWR